MDQHLIWMKEHTHTPIHKLHMSSILAYYSLMQVSDLIGCGARYSPYPSLWQPFILTVRQLSSPLVSSCFLFFSFLFLKKQKTNHNIVIVPVIQPSHLPVLVSGQAGWILAHSIVKCNFHSFPLLFKSQSSSIMASLLIQQRSWIISSPSLWRFYGFTKECRTVKSLFPIALVTVALELWWHEGGGGRGWWGWEW